MHGFQNLLPTIGICMYISLLLLLSKIQKTIVRVKADSDLTKNISYLWYTLVLIMFTLRIMFGCVPDHDVDRWNVEWIISVLQWLLLFHMFRIAIHGNSFNTNQYLGKREQYEKKHFSLALVCLFFVNLKNWLRIILSH